MSNQQTPVPSPDPLISIVMPVYNAENYLSQCLDSLLRQTVTDFEIILVDDASTDASRDLIGQYMKTDARISLFANPENRFAGVCRNLGFEKARGKYCVFLDSDDFFEPDLLEKAVCKAELEKADITAYFYRKYDDQTCREEFSPGSVRRYFLPNGTDTFSRDTVPDRILDAIDPVPWNKLYRTAFIREKGLKFSGYSTSNDFTFASLSLLEADKVAFIEDALVHYRVNVSHSITSQKSKKLMNIVGAVEEVEAYVRARCDFARYDAALTYFVVNKLCFSIASYAKNVTGKFYRRFYRYLHARLNSDAFRDLTKEYLRNVKLYERYVDIRDTPYHVLLLRHCKATLRERARKFRVLRKAHAFYRATRREGVGRAIQKTFSWGYRKAFKKPFGFSERIEARERKKACAQRRKPHKRALYRGETRSEKLIVSLTTFPERVDDVPATLRSLEMQTLKPDEIILYLAESQFPGRKLPRALIRHKSAGVKFVFCEDMKPHKKYFFAMEKYPNDIVVTVDDDVFYAPTLLERLYRAHLANPDCVCATRVHEMSFASDGQPKSYDAWKMSIAYSSGPSMQYMATGVGGILYPPHSLHQEVFRKEAIYDTCLYADDLWLKLMEVMNRTKVALVRMDEPVEYIGATQENALFSSNVGEGRNDVQLRNILNRYNTYFGEEDTLLSRMNERAHVYVNLHGSDVLRAALSDRAFSHMNLHQQIVQSGIIPLSYPPYSPDESVYQGLPRWLVDTLRRNFEKLAYQQLNEESANAFLIIDLLEERLPLLHIRDRVKDVDTFVTNIYSLKTRTDFLKPGGCLNNRAVQSELVPYMSLPDLDKYYRNFAEKILAMYNSNSIVILEAYMATEYIDKGGSVLPFPEKSRAFYQEVNDRLQPLYALLKKELQPARVIRYPGELRGWEGHKKGLSATQFTDDYYAYVRKELLNFLGELIVEK